MPPETDPTAAIDALRAERDAARQELADLRAWLTVKLGLLHRAPGPQGITVLSVATDREIITKIEELMKGEAQA
ncbi:hypothetical protein OHS18_48335 [Amycolatopsis sp. NBC_00355]|uniref:hypothetical protein n=1 Tax=Amycolatopsis sp. NBC_00355 TaxID=2975957 RepID=UPI002E2656C2